MDIFVTANFGATALPETLNCYAKTSARVRSLIERVAKVGGTCDIRFTSSPRVCAGPEARARGQCQNVPDMEEVLLHGRGVPGEISNVEKRDGITFYTVAE